MDFLIINPKIPSQKKVDRVPNFGALCIASYLGARGYYAAIFDLVQESEEELIYTIKDKKPKLIGFSCTSAESYYEAHHVCKKIKSLVSTPVIVGGQHITGLMSEGANNLDCVFDCHISGPGEVSIAVLLSNLADGAIKLPPIIYSAPVDTFVSIDYKLYPNYNYYL